MDFKSTMLDMKNFYIGNTEEGGSYKLDLNIEILRFGSPELPSEVHEIDTKFKSDSANFLNENETNFTDATQTFKQNKNTDAFRQLMSSKKQEALDSANKKISDLYDNMMKAGEKFPEQQDNILSITNGLSQFFHGNILQGVVTIANSLINVVHDVINNIKKYFNNVKDFAKKWLGGLFIAPLDSFGEKVDKQKQLINEALDKLLEAGQNSPESQDNILNAIDRIDWFITGFKLAFNK